MVIKEFFKKRKKAREKSGGTVSNYTKEELRNLKKYAPGAYKQIIKMQREQEKRKRK
jgi:hypothetical protein